MEAAEKRRQEGQARRVEQQRAAAGRRVFPKMRRDCAGLSVKAGKAQLLIELVTVGLGVTGFGKGRSSVRQEYIATAWFGGTLVQQIDQRHGLCDGTSGVDMMPTIWAHPNLLDLRLISGRGPTRTPPHGDR
jgi:hypothetical protein